MAATVNVQTNVVLVRGVDQESVTATVGRKGLVFQNIGSGDVWCKLGSEADIEDGFLLPEGVLTVLGSMPGNGNQTDVYEGSVHLFWAGGVAPDGSRAVTGLVRILEMI